MRLFLGAIIAGILYRIFTQHGHPVIAYTCACFVWYWFGFMEGEDHAANTRS